jgi:ligand-binding sensor domain-containing protein
MKPMKLFLLLTGLLVALVVKTASAQRYPFYNLNVENGLIQSQARGLAQDKDGNLWISTLGGLSRFDGESFTNYTVRDGMLSNDINTVAADAAGKIWVGFSKGISSYDGKSFKHYRLQSNEVNDGNVVTDIVSSPIGTWCVSSGKVYQINGGKIKALLLPDGETKATALLYAGGRLYVACNNGMLYSQKEGIFDSVRFRTKNIASTVLDIFQDSRRRLWLATSYGPLEVVGDHVDPVKVRGVSLEGISTLSITEDNQGALWLALPNGVLNLTDSTIQWFNKKNGLSDNPFYKLLTDKEGNVWMASDGQGVFRFSGAQFTSIDERTGLPSAQVMSIASDYKGKLFLGTYDAGLYVFEKNRINKLKLPVEGDLPIMALNYVDETLWIGTAGAGLLRYKNGHLTAYTTENSSLPSNYVASLYYNEEGQLLIGTLNGGALFKNNKFSILPIKGTIVHSAINIGNDSLLVATGNGLELIYKDQVTRFVTGKAPDSASPKCMLKTGDELWIGTSDNGAICYNLRTKKAMVLNKNNGMRSDFVYNLIADNEGNIWAGTGYGIHKIVKNEKGSVSIFFYGREQGISGMESNLNSVLKMPDGSIWFGTTNGAQHYQPSNKMVVSEPSSLVLHSIRVFGEDIKDTTYFDSTGAWYNIPYGLKLPPKKNNVTFTFHAVTLAGKEQVRYRYKIANLDAIWSEWTDINTVT